VGLWHSVDRVSLAREIARRSPGARVLLQVNLTDEPQKGGCPPTELDDLRAAVDDMDLTVAGLMTIGPQGPAEAARPAFTELSRLADRHGLEARSMGMSSDLEVALQEGATIVRIGSALFGPRPGRSRVED
jgi:PLP dependent protein